MKIPLPKMMRHWREDQFQKKLTPPTARTGLKVWAFFAKRPKLYHLAARLAMAVLGFLGSGKGRFSWLPFASGWTGTRDMPTPSGTTFQAAFAKRSKKP